MGHEALPGHTCNLPSFLPSVAIPRWFAPGHARTEAAEHAVITQAQRRCWDQLCRPNIRKADIAVAWRALHCQLRTPSFLTYCRYKSGAVERSGDTPMQRACCRWPACRTPLATDPTILQPTTIADTTHILLHQRRSG